MLSYDAGIRRLPEGSFFRYIAWYPLLSLEDELLHIEGKTAGIALERLELLRKESWDSFVKQGIPIHSPNGELMRLDGQQKRICECGCIE